MSSSRNGRWIRVAVAVFEHPMFEDEPFSRREAWLWLIANAAYQDTEHRVGSTMHKVSPGCQFTTQRRLQKIWKWKSDTRVRAFLRELERNGMISQQTDAGKTHISICNYEHFQRSTGAENAKKTRPERKNNAQKKQIIPKHTESKKDREFDFDLEEFQSWFRTWPSWISDDEAAAMEAWSQLTRNERCEVIVATPRYVEGARANHRTMFRSAAKFLAERHWERIRFLPSQERPAARSAQSSVRGLNSKSRETANPAPKTPEELDAARRAFHRDAIKKNDSWG